MSDRLAPADLNPTAEEMAAVLEVLRAKREMPPRVHGSLILAAWINRDIPARDYLLGNVLCTTSRWFVIGETGVGKTLFGAELGACCAEGSGFLNWKAGRPCRVMYIDGELPVETFKERMQLIASRHGPGLQFFGYNREYLGSSSMPPLNTTAGQIWLWREIDIVKPDLIIFDSIMCLLVGPMSDEATWAPMKQLVCELSARRIAQIWFNHANDLGKSFGDKTREWEMDTVAKLAKVEGEEGAFQLEFTKARLRVPATAAQFAPIIVRPGANWTFSPAAKSEGGNAKGPSMAWIIRTEFMTAYDRLADSVKKTPGQNGKPVAKVAGIAITAELKTRGFLPLDEKGSITHPGRQMLATAKAQLLKARRIVENDTLIWRI